MITPSHPIARWSPLSTPRLLFAAVALSLLAAFVLLSGHRAEAAVIIANPGFESGDFAGWTTIIPSGASAKVVTNHDAPAPGPYGAPSGSYFAELKTDGPGSNTIVRQTIIVDAGETITGWAFFRDVEFELEQPCFFADNAQVEILDSGSNVIATPFFAQHCVTDSTPWTPWSHTFAAAGTYIVQARVQNVGDSGFDSFMGFDLDGPAGRLSDLTVTKVAKPGQPAPVPGGLYRYIVRVYNVGNAATPAAPVDVTLRDTVLGGATVSGWTASTGTCSVSANQLDCKRSRMSVGEVWWVEVTVRLPWTQNGTGTISNTATVDIWNRIAELNENNNTATHKLVLWP